MPQDMMDDLLIQGTVTSKSTGLPVEGIKVSAAQSGHFSITNSYGVFLFYTPVTESLVLSFVDIDPNADGNYISRDTVLNHPGDQVVVHMALEEQ